MRAVRKTEHIAYQIHYHFVTPVCTNGCTNWQTSNTFTIIGKNMFNRKEPKTFTCAQHPAAGVVHTGNDHSYIHLVKWDDFVSNINGYLTVAFQMQENLDDYEIVKIV